MKMTALISTTLVISACHGAGISDLEAERRVSTLAEFEAANLCESVTEYVSGALESKDWVRWTCIQAGVELSRTGGCDDARSCRSSCENVTYECEGSRELYGKTFRDFVDCGRIKDYDYDDCGATVSQVESCAEEVREASISWSEEASCDVNSGWRPSKRLSAGCQQMVRDYDCSALFYGGS